MTGRAPARYYPGMSRTLAVAINTFREAVRDRVLYGVLGLALVSLSLSFALGEMALDQGDRVVLDVGLASTSLFAVLVSIFLGSSLLYKEIERKTLYVILPKPIARYEFLLGKYFGITLTATVFVAITGGVQFVVVALRAGLNPMWALLGVIGLFAALGVATVRAYDRTAVIVPWSLAVLAVGLGLASRTPLELTPIASAVVLIVGEVLVLTAVALVFSAFSTPFLTALFTLGVWLVGRSADTMATLRSGVIPESVKEALQQLVHVWPNFHLFVPGHGALERSLGDGAITGLQAGPLSYVGTTMTYAVTYSAMLLLAAALIFRRRDFL